MKLMKRSATYKASNVTFNYQTMEAHSYQWWAFVKVIDDQIIFNKYPYSTSTRRHQYKVYRLMQELGIHINRIAQVRHGLQNINTLEELNIAENHTITEIKQNEEYKRRRKNRLARKRRAANLIKVG